MTLPDIKPFVANLAEVTLLGNLVSAPEIRYQTNPVLAVTDITIATHQRWFDKQKNGYQEWTTFHSVKVIGNLVEQQLLHADKGDILLIKGYFWHDSKKDKPLLIARHIEHFNKGFTNSINQVQCSGTISQCSELVATSHNKAFCQLALTTQVEQLSPISQQKQQKQLTQQLHCFGKVAEYAVQHVELNQRAVILGELSYSNEAGKPPFIDVKHISMIKNSN